ncbi:MAG: cell division protein ZapD [Gammaproteobacteria bacterium]|nr:cell division protein ZapD [Gammaproteobacteria bacterium]
MNIITYEQPLNERIRTFLRLEFLFQQANHGLQHRSSWDTRASLSNLIEILNVFGRTDLKTEVIKELERLTVTLSRLEANPEVDGSKLNALMDKIDLLVDRLHSYQGQVGQELKDNEFLTAIKQRSSIPGGTCDFDLPVYHFWLKHEAEERDTQLRRWLSAFDTFRTAIDLILKLVRESAPATQETASAGFYQQSLDTATPYQLIRVSLPADVDCFAEISGGKHRFTVRFMEMHDFGRPSQSQHDIAFRLNCCAI